MAHRGPKKEIVSFVSILSVRDSVPRTDRDCSVNDTTITFTGNLIDYWTKPNKNFTSKNYFPLKVVQCFELSNISLRDAVLYNHTKSFPPHGFTRSFISFSVETRHFRADPEELMRRKFHAKCLFRRIGRLAMENVFWLIEDIDEYKGVEDVKRRVEQAVRGKAKRQLLSIKDKALLNKEASERTEHEKKYLNRKIGGLKCFKRYPNHVKRKLAAVTYFRYYGPNRVVVRQHHEAHALYFIVSGTVMVSHLEYDELLEEDVSVELGEMVAGEMFGEISLLHNIPRTATVTTTDHCEFLMLPKADFNHVLLTSIQKQWDEVRLAMSSFTYFDALDEMSFREGCIVAKMKKFGENETVLGDGVGINNYVYFLLTGRIQMIESLQIFVSKRLGKNFYTLFDPYVSPEPSETDFETKWFANYNKRLSDEMSVSRLLHSKRSIATQTRSGSVGQSILKMRDRSSQRHSAGSFRASLTVTTSTGEHRPSSEGPKTSKTEATEGETVAATSVAAVGATSVAAVETDKLEESKRASFDEKGLEVRERSVDLINVPHVVTMSTQTVESRKLSIESPKQSMTGSKLYLPPISEHERVRPSVRYSVAPDTSQIGRRKLKTFFMQVCIMNPGSTFGFGENMRDRRMIALTPVHLMLIPKMWLLQRNTANIWTRIQYWLSKKIPNKQQLFEEFCKQRIWQDYKNECVQDVVDRSKTVNYTTIHDVPYSIRLDEMLGI